ncbi:DNA starvation/stationary phase protection protein [bacterium]|nr:DNA starvation/stationary phase protection protein [bacterium]
MDELVTAMKIVLANTYAMYFKAHGFHWNVEGKDFSQLHEFFGNIYEEVFAAADTIAEEIRALDAFAPYGMQTLADIATIKDSAIYGNSVPSMLSDLISANSAVIEALNSAHKLAEAEGNNGLLNLLEERLDVHAKHAWMLRATSR